MSNSQHHRALLESSDGKLPATTTGGRNKFATVNERSGAFNKSLVCQDELNNNSIILPAISVQATSVPPLTITTTTTPSHAYANQQHLQAANQNLNDFKHLTAASTLNMDQYSGPRGPASQQKESPTIRHETNLNTLSSANPAPSYSTLLDTAPMVNNSPRQPSSPSGKMKQPGSTQRLPLKKQSAQLLLDHDAGRGDLSLGSKRVSNIAYDSNLNHEDEEPEDEEEYDDEGEDEHASERLPFGMNKLRSSGRLNLESHKSHKIPNAKLPYANHKKAHTKISMHENSKPPSFHSSYHPECITDRRLEWQKNGSSCSCVGSQYLKAGISQSDWKNLSPERKPSKTKSMHLVLKSIILILLTLILAMLLMGFVAASHYLPQMFDKLLSASRSFNVTISG